MDFDLDTIVNWVNQLYGLPAGVLVGLLCIVICYAFKVTDRFPNDAIPVVCLLLGAILLPMLAPECPLEEKLIAYRVKHAVVGIIVGLVAWAFHNLILSKIEDKIPWLGKAMKTTQPETKNETTPPNVTP